jgi:hypothetical protein
MTVFNPQPLRTYQLVWMKLRRPPHKIVLDIHAEELLPRIKRMISKEKDRDLGFKLLRTEIEFFRLVYTWSPETRQLTIELKSKIGLTDPI